jgi:hypothetical protein
MIPSLSLLRERFFVAPEMSDQTGVVCLITIGDTGEYRPSGRLLRDALGRTLAQLAE